MTLHQRGSGVYIVNFEHTDNNIQYIDWMLLFVTLNKYFRAGVRQKCFYF